MSTAFWPSWCKMSKVYSVTKLNAYIKNMFAMDYALSGIQLEGEVSNCKYHSAGHIYFTLKDEKSQIGAVMFAGKRSSGLKIHLKDGMKVLVRGSVEVYERGGTYQLYATQIEEAGFGNLYEKYLQLKEKLAAEGLFAADKKKPVPQYARRVGIITSPTGAAIQDIIQVSRRRNPYVELFLYPSLVQGEGAAADIVKAIAAMDALQLDVIILGRGGGSMEDLWAFNEESVARAVFAANTPIISAVGHETDFTICDFTADLRAATPSQAAEFANFDYGQFLTDLDTLRIRLRSAFGGNLVRWRNRLQQNMLRLQARSPERSLHQYRNYLMDLENKCAKAISFKLAKAQSDLALYAGRLESLSPISRIAAGYAYVSDAKGKRISRAADAKEKDCILIQFSDGRLRTEVTEIEKES